MKLRKEKGRTGIMSCMSELNGVYSTRVVQKGKEDKTMDEELIRTRICSSVIQEGKRLICMDTDEVGAGMNL